MKPRILVSLLVLLAVAIGAFFVIQSRNDDADPELAAGGEAPMAGAEAPAEATSGQPEQQAAAPAEPPVFELVRVEPTGDLVAAGLAAAGSDVELLAGDDVLAKTTATSTGEWALVLDEPLPVGSHDLALRSIAQGGGEPLYGDRVAVVIAGNGETPLVAVTSEGQPSRVVQQPDADQDAETAAVEEPAEQDVAMAGDAAGEGGGADAPGDEAAAERSGAEGAGETGGADGQADGEGTPGAADVAAADQVGAGTEGDAAAATNGAVTSPAPGPGASEGQQIASTSEGDETAGDDGAGERREAASTGEATPVDASGDARQVDASQPVEQRMAAAGSADGEAGAPGAAAETAEVAPRDPADATRDLPAAGDASAAGEGAGDPSGSSSEAPEIAVAEEAEREQASQNLATAEAEPRDVESRSAAAAGPAADEPAALGNEGDVTIETVEVEEPNRLMMSGETKPDRPVRVYVNNERVGEVQADAAGNWFLTAAREMPPGSYEVRADVVDDGGQVTARSAVRFDRVQVAFAGDAAASEAEAPAAQGEGSGSAGTGTGAGAAGDASIVMINRGDNLWTIARKLYGEGVRYTVIYDANRNQIRNPSLIYPGQVFTLPELQEEPAEAGSEG